MGIAMRKRRKEKEEDLVSLMMAAGVSYDEIRTYLFTGKISQSIADKVFHGRVPDKYKDIIVSDEEFKELMEEVKIFDKITDEENEELSNMYTEYEKIDYN